MVTPNRLQILLLATETEWREYAQNYASLRQWLWYHTHDSRRSSEGFPDDVFVRGGRMVFVEFKKEKDSTTTFEQDVWLGALREVAAAAPRVIEVYLWRPSDVEEMERVLA